MRIEENKNELFNSDSDMELISKRHSSELTIECFRRGFMELFDADFKQKATQGLEDEESSLELFQNSFTDEWVIWFADSEDTVEEFWLIFSEEKEQSAKDAFVSLSKFFNTNLSKLGHEILPYQFEDMLYDQFAKIWGK